MFRVGLAGEGEYFWYFSSPTWFDQGSNISTDMEKGAQRTYIAEGELDMVVPSGHHLLRGDYRDSQEKLTFVDQPWNC